MFTYMHTRIYFSRLITVLVANLACTLLTNNMLLFLKLKKQIKSNS
jgi:hypothetical protein